MLGSGAGAMTGGRVRAGPGGLVDELLADGAPPEDLGFDDVELLVAFFACLVPLVGIGEGLVVDEDGLDEDFEVFGEAVSLGAAGSRGV